MICFEEDPHKVSNSSDPAPLVPLFVGERSQQLAANCGQVIASGPDPGASPYWKRNFNESAAAMNADREKGPVEVSGHTGSGIRGLRFPPLFLSPVGALLSSYAPAPVHALDLVL